MKYQFKYAYWKNATVTVYAESIDEAVIKSRITLDNRYEKANKEPPIAWTLELIGIQ